MRIKQTPSEQTAWMLGHVEGFTRYTGQLISWQQRPEVDDQRMLKSPYLYGVFFTVPADREEAFNEWYEEEHAPLLLNCEQWLGCPALSRGRWAPGRLHAYGTASSAGSVPAEPRPRGRACHALAGEARRRAVVQGAVRRLCPARRPVPGDDRRLTDERPITAKRKRTSQGPRRRHRSHSGVCVKSVWIRRADEPIADPFVMR